VRIRALPEEDDPLLSQTFARLGHEATFAPQIELRSQSTVRDMRLEVRDNADYLYYPALSAPLGSDDDVTCPPEHVDRLKQVVGHRDWLHVLVIGYSGLDTAVLKLLASGERHVRSLSVVSETEQHAKETADRVESWMTVARPNAGVAMHPVTLWPQGFTAFTQGRDLDDYIALIRRVAARDDEISP
jgi:hypothetical protein